MLRWFVSLATAGLVGLLAVTAFAQAVIPGVSSIQREPAVVFDVSGGTLLGPVNIHMTVYNDGEVLVAKNTGIVPDIDFQKKNVGKDAANKLARALANAGAFQLTDQSIFVSDVPLSTLTVLRGGTDAKAHTYSYWIGTGPYAAPAQIVNAFLTTHFPGL